ncbi:MAG: redoxin domain-containing protein [candidate division Zixibacteria bacterium]|nr:redoxin domain-containing protein [candidate division Zixibacteria bacterium]
MSEQKNNSLSISKIILIAILVFGAVFGGVYMGLRSRSQEPEPILSMDGDTLLTSFTNGTIFPQEEFMTEEGTLISSAELYKDSGAVLLFMELGCPPCNEISQLWQDMIDSNLIDRQRVAGITYSLPGEIRMYKKEHSINFLIYSDTGLVFMTKYDVRNFPLAVYVGQSGKVQGHTFDSKERIDANTIAIYLAQ